MKPKPKPFATINQIAETVGMEPDALIEKLAEADDDKAEARLDKQGYDEAVARLRSISMQCVAFDFEVLLKAIAMAESVGPIIDPTTFQRVSRGKGREYLEMLKAITEHVMAIRQIVERQLEKERPT